jgi:hypothetical protein
VQLAHSHWPERAYIGFPFACSPDPKAAPGQKILGLAKHYSEDDRNVLRKAGVNALVEIDGKVYKPVGGITTAGTSIRASLTADQVIRATERLEAALRNDPQQFQRFAQDNGMMWPTNPTGCVHECWPTGAGGFWPTCRV